MRFDLHALDALEPGSDEADEAFDHYSRSLLEVFRASIEGKVLLETASGIGFWVRSFLDFGYNHEGMALPSMGRQQVEMVVSDYFPRKISLNSPEEADSAIPELIAFWEFLGREFGLQSAQSVVVYLREVQPSFRSWMLDPSKFGMAKSFFMAGQAAGFNMTDKSEMNAFAEVYNAANLREGLEATGVSPGEARRERKKRARSLRRKIKGASRKRHK